MIKLEQKKIYQNLAKGLKLETKLPKTYFKKTVIDILLQLRVKALERLLGWI